MPKRFDKKSMRLRTQIAQLAAKLMAENGIVDFSFAKRKAAQQMGVTDTNALPGNQEVECALREYHAIYQGEKHLDLIHVLRQEALGIMQLLERFNPYLTGPVLSGVATRFSAININLYTENDKEVELFFLSRQINYARREKRILIGGETMLVPCLSLESHEMPIEILLMSPTQLKPLSRKEMACGALPRAGLAQVRTLLE